MPDARPAWSEQLAHAPEPVSWRSAITNANEHAVVGLLRRHGIPDPGVATDRAAAVMAALDAGTLTEADLLAWRDDVLSVFDAIDCLNDFRQKDPIVQSFRMMLNRPMGNLGAVLDDLRCEMWRGDLMRQRWVDYLDDQRDQLDRDLFLYRFADLNRWKDESAFDADLRAYGFTHVAGATHHQWKPAAPELVGVYRVPPRVELRWVSWRNPARRCMTYARIDYESGQAELQLSRMTAGGMRALVAERDFYAAEMARLAGAQPELVSVEGAMWPLMRQCVEVDFWRIRVGLHGELSGRRMPAPRSRREGDHALELRAEWMAAPQTPLSLRLDSRTDVVSVHCQCSPAQADGLVAVVRGHEAPGRAAPDVDRLVKYIRHISKEEDVDLDSLKAALLDDLAIEIEELRKILETVGVGGTGAKLYFICPETHTAVTRGGKKLILDKLPDFVECENHGPTPVKHSTLEAVRIDPGVEPQPPLAKAELWWLAYMGAFVLLSWGFAQLSAMYSHETLFLVPGFALATIAPVAVIYLKYGKEAFDAATELITRFLGPVKRKYRRWRRSR